MSDKDHEDASESFKVIGGLKDPKAEAVKRVLPRWLSHPTVISADISGDKAKISHFDCLDETIRNNLKENKVKYLFPVQQEVIPYILKSYNRSICCRPQDICISAPTGSGKTLAYVLPIVQILKDRVVCKIRALVVLPVKELAVQVYKVFLQYVKGTNLKIGLAVGEKALLTEQFALAHRATLYGYTSKVDILIATPGRLLDHLLNTPEFTLTDLRFFVLDEADRLMTESEQGWLEAAEKTIYGSEQISCQCCGDLTFSRFNVGLINPCAVLRVSLPCQKLLYSATLSHNPEILQRVSLFNPKLFTSVLDPPSLITKDQENGTSESLQKGDFIGRFTVPNELSEFVFVCEENIKPQLVWFLMHEKSFKRTLCFTNSVINTHRLFLLVKEMGDVVAEEFSSNISSGHRSQVIKRFNEGKIDILICSDAMARGMDFNHVEYVLCYDCPSRIETYIHRVGRTARGGVEGTAISFLIKKDLIRFNQLIRKSRKKSILPYKINLKDVAKFAHRYEFALKKVEMTVKREIQARKNRENTYSKKKANFK